MFNLIRSHSENFEIDIRYSLLSFKTILLGLGKVSMTSWTATGETRLS